MGLTDNTHGKRFWLLVLLALLVALIGGQIVSARHAEDVTAVAAKAEVEAVEADRPVDPLSKLDDELTSLAQDPSGEAVTAYILAETGTDLSGIVEVTETRPFIDKQLIVAEVEPSEVLKMASDPGVVAAEVFHPVPAPKPLTPADVRGDGLEIPTLDEAGEIAVELRAEAEERRSGGAEGFTLPEAAQEALSAATSGRRPRAAEDYYGSDVIGAQAAWAKGYTGEGVQVAIVDSGVDFGHPDLEGTQAVYEEGPYEGWPIALDPRSMREYYYNGRTALNNWGPYPPEDADDVSWYGLANNVIICTEGTVETFNAGGWIYSIDADIVDMSQSGEIRWGFHPDPWLSLGPSPAFEWPPFILVDSTEAHVYDTVITDLNFDRWIDAHDDMATKSDPVLNADFGSYVLTDTLVMTGTQYVPAFWFGLPPTWWGVPGTVAGTPMTVTAGSFILSYNHFSDSYIEDASDMGWEPPTDGADGVADISGGMIYYIADGDLPIPGMDYLYPNYGPGGLPPVPPNGHIVAFMLGTVSAGGGDHGTLVASAVAARGEAKGYYGPLEVLQYDPYEFHPDWPWGNGDISEGLPFHKAPDEGSVQGPAPDAEIIAIGDVYAVVNGMQGIYDGQTFLAYGVDGEPNTGDEYADLVNFSFGDGSVNNDGWDFDSRLTSYYNQTFQPNTTFCVSSGNGGHGYGTVNSPQGNSVVSVGASTLYGPNDFWGGGVSMEQFNDGEVTSFSGRGPDALGRPDPDVTATGAWALGDGVLNYYIYLASPIFQGDGNNSWFEWGGTSRAAPEACGVLALLYEAYEEANGSFPDHETARELLMNSAQDLNHDVLIQGAGRVDADRGTDVAGGLDGIHVSPGLLQAGEYMGTHYDAFGNVLFPGDTWTQAFTVTNMSGSTASVTVGDEVLQEMETLTYTMVVSPYLGMEDPFSFFYSHYLLVADPSQAVISNTNPVTPSLGMTMTLHGDSLALPIPAGADFMQVQLATPFELFDYAYTDPNPGTVNYSSEDRFQLWAYDWTDRNGDGKLWADAWYTDTFGIYRPDGVVNPFVVGYPEMVDHAGDLYFRGPTGYVTETEMVPLNISYLIGGQQEVVVRLGERPDLDNVVIGVRHLTNLYRWQGTLADTAAYYQENPLTIKVVYYEKADWDLVAEDTTSLSVPAGGSATFDAEFSIPADQAPGLYAGAITVDDGTHTTLVPTTVNVAVPGDELLFTLGGNERAETPYDNGRGFGAWTWSGALEEGDWRFYYYDAGDAFAQQYLYVENEWGDVCSNMPTWYDTLVWGPNPGDQFSLMEPEKYGPHGNQFAGGTPLADMYLGGGPRPGFWYRNVDGIALPESRAYAQLWNGLNQVQFRQTLGSGKYGCGDGYEATAGVFGVDAAGYPNGVYVETDALSGSFTMDAVSPVDGMYAWSFGLAEEEIFRNQDVPQGLHRNPWPADLMDGWVYTFEVTNTFAIEAETFGPWSSDIDLYLLYDANGDGIFNLSPENNRETLAYDFSGDSDEYIYYAADFTSGYQYWGQIPDGTYAVVMYGYAVNEGDQFDLHLTTYGGDGVTVEGATGDNNYLLSTTPGETFTAIVQYDVPESGVYSTNLIFAMPWEEVEAYAQAPFIMVPVTINAGGADFSHSSKTVDREMINTTYSGRHEVLTYTIEIRNTGNADQWIELSDLLPENTIYAEQCITDTDHPDHGTCYIAKWWFENGEYGYLWPDGNGYLNGSWYVGPTASGTLYIEYRVKVEHGFAGTITNKADVHVNYGLHNELMALTAETEVMPSVFLPVVAKMGSAGG